MRRFHPSDAGAAFSRRDVLRLGALGASLPEWLAWRQQAAAAAPSSAPRRLGRAKSCIVLFSWGGMSHLDTWDPKPAASADIRGEFEPIATSMPGIFVSEHMPRLA